MPGAQPALGQTRSDVDLALASVHASATAGDLVAQFSLGSVLYYSGEDVPQAVSWFRRAAEGGFAPAEFQLGQLYDFGLGVAADDGAALSWYRRAADHGQPAAHRLVGDFYRKGRAVPVDEAEAARWYRRAADADDLRAQYQLGQMYFDGTGVPRNYVEAYVWFDIAANQTPLTDNRKAIVELRDIAAVRMTPAELEDATRRAAGWKPAR